MKPKRKYIRKPEQRRALLAKVHIAKKELGLDETVYRMILRDEFGVDSSGKLTIGELEQLVARFKRRGWQSRPSKGDDQAFALREKTVGIMKDAGFSEKRSRGLVQKICGVSDLRFVQDPRKLKRLLKVLSKIREDEQ